MMCNACAVSGCGRVARGVEGFGGDCACVYVGRVDVAMWGARGHDSDCVCAAFRRELHNNKIEYNVVCANPNTTRNRCYIVGERTTLFRLFSLRTLDHGAPPRTHVIHLKRLVGQGLAIGHGHPQGHCLAIELPTQSQRDQSERCEQR